MQRVLAILAALAIAAPAAAHEVLHEVQRGRAIALHAFEDDGDPLADLDAEVYSPANPATPHWKGRTDRNGWLAFVPDVPGRWRVRIVDPSGHGLDTTVDVASPVAADTAAHPSAFSFSGPLAFILRPALGVVLVAAIFGFLFQRGRRKTS